jgi:hypothetical protein
MSKLLQAPVCEKHGCEKVWIRDKHKTSGGMWRCRECNNEQSRARNARNQADPKKREELNAYYRERWAKLPQEEKDARNQQIIAQRFVRLENDPEARQAKNDYQNARRKTLSARHHRNTNLKKSYGITIDDYDRMFEQQQGKCAICGSTESRTRRSKHFYVDHCHETGQVRGLLCGPCNTGIGNLGDDLGRLEQAVLYLRKHELGTAAA